MDKKLSVHIADEQFEIELRNENIFYKGEKLAIDVRKYGNGKFNILYKGKSYELLVSPTSEKKRFEVSLNGQTIATSVQTELDQLLSKLGFESKKGSKITDLLAPMPGLIIDIPLTVGDTVEKGDSLLVLEAMKMENNIKATAPGTLSAICVKKGEKVEKGQVLLKFD